MKRDTKTHDPEAQAIAAISAALKDVPDERRLAVLSFVSERLGGKALAGGQTQGGAGGADDGHAHTPAGNIKAFLKAKDPGNKYQQTAVLAYYLKKHGGEDQIGKESIESANKEAGGRTIDDITGTLNDAKSKYGYFGAGAGGKKILLAFGEDVVEALPDQEKVKVLRRANLGKSKRKSKKKKQK